jgi:hypothetical protein
LLKFFLAGAQAVIAGHNGIVRSADGKTVEGEPQGSALLFDALSEAGNFTFQGWKLLSCSMLADRVLNAQPGLDTTLFLRSCFFRFFEKGLSRPLSADAACSREMKGTGEQHALF